MAFDPTSHLLEQELSSRVGIGRNRGADSEKLYLGSRYEGWFLGRVSWKVFGDVVGKIAGEGKD